MTPAQRKTLRAVVRQAEMITESYPGVIVVPNVGIGPEELDALRAALVERGTCGNCRWAQSSTCVNPDSMHDVTKVMHEDDGCIRGWSPREDAPEDAR